MEHFRHQYRTTTVEQEAIVRDRLSRVIRVEENGGFSRPHPRSGDIESVEVHDLVPGRHKIVHELFRGVLTGVDLCHGPELRVRTEDQVDTGAGPPDLARGAIPTLEDPIIFRRCLPRRSYVEQIHEEVIGERLWPLGEDAVLGLSKVGVQYAHAANQNRHLWSDQRQQLRPIDQQFLC